MTLVGMLAGAARRAMVDWYSAARTRTRTRSSTWKFVVLPSSKFISPRHYTSVVLSNVYPDVSASAACVRTNSIVHGLAGLPVPRETCQGRVDEEGNDSGADSTASGAKNRVYYATSVDLAHKEGDTKNPFDCGHLHPSGHPSTSFGSIQMIHLPPNRSDLLEEHFLVETEQEQSSASSWKDEGGQPSGECVDLVVFDRFYVEEAHSFRFRQAFPNAALVLDMQDMHSLRWGRQAIVEAWDKEQRNQRKVGQQEQQGSGDWDPLGCLPQVLDYLPAVAETNNKNDRFLRELASVHRSDLVLVCSPLEMHWLQSVYKVPEEKLCLASFFVDETTTTISRDQDKSLPQSPSCDDAKLPPRFVFCGGFKHAPNADAVRILIDFVWPKLRAELPTATLHIYGAFCPDQLQALHNKNSKTTGIHVHGYEPDLATIFGKDDGILLAPLRFGAGIKGKIIDAWTFGMPVVTTPIGSEGMTIDRQTSKGSRCVFGGSIASTLDEFCEEAILLAKQPQDYRRAQSDGKFLLQELFSASKNWKNVQTRLLDVLEKDSLIQTRQKDYTQAMLWHQSLRSTEYFSRWVELKERNVRETQQRDDVSLHTEKEA